MIVWFCLQKKSQVSSCYNNDFVSNFITKVSFTDEGLFHSWIHNTLTVFNNLILSSTRRQTDSNITPIIFFFNNNRNKVKKNTTPYQNLWILFKMALPTNQHNHWLTGNICRNPIRFFHQSHNTVLFGGLFTLKQWIISSLKHDTVPRVNKLYCFYVKNPPKRIALWDRENSQLAENNMQLYVFIQPLIKKSSLSAFKKSSSYCKKLTDNFEQMHHSPKSKKPHPDSKALDSLLALASDETQTDSDHGCPTPWSPYTNKEKNRDKRIPEWWHDRNGWKNGWHTS